MRISLKSICFLLGLFIYLNTSIAADVKVVYPGWFKESFYDLKADLQDANKSGKKGISVFVSMKTCSYCKAMIETAFQKQDIVKRLRDNYDVIGLEVFSDTEVVDVKGKSHWAKDFAARNKAMFTPTMLFYDTKGRLQLRLVGYQSPVKFRHVLDYLEGNLFYKMKLSTYLAKQKSTQVKTASSDKKLNLQRQGRSTKSLLVVVESTDCEKCQQFRRMLKASVLKPYLGKLDLAFVNQDVNGLKVITPGGKTQDAKQWVKSLETIHRPSMVFFNEKGKEVVRVDFDILIDPYGKRILDSNERILDNIRARLQFVADKGYVAMPQFQRWRKEKALSR